MFSLYTTGLNKKIFYQNNIYYALKILLLSITIYTTGKVCLVR